MTRALSALLALAPGVAFAAPVAPINAVVGDASWVEAFGHAPTMEEARTLDDARHRVHLAWIEARLRAAPTDHLDDVRRERRRMLLDALAEYRRAGVHPVNPRAERLPRWLDEAGRVCAVGHLMERTAGRAFVERVNARHEHAFLMDIEGDRELDAWIAESGLSKRELASIQPTGAPGPVLPEWDGRLESDANGDAILAGVGVGLLLAANVGAFFAGRNEDAHPPSVRLLPVALAQVLLGAVQLLAGSVLLGVVAADELGDGWEVGVLTSSIGFSLAAAIQIVDGGVRLARPPDPR